MLTLNGHAVLDAVLSFPLTGIWHADVRVDTQDEIQGPAVINVDDGRLFLSGTVAAGGNWQDTGILRVVGGAGGLRKVAKPKHYTSTTLRIVINDLLSDAGEKLSGRSDGIISRSVSAWTTAALPAGRLITQLLLSGAPGSNWRVLPDGTVWAGRDGWPDSGLKEDDFQVLSEDPSRAEAELGLEVPLLMPGTRLGDRRVSYVEHRIGEETRTAVWFQTAGADDRLKAALRGAVKSAQAPIDYLCHYFAHVVSQTGHHIDVRPSDPRIPSMAAVPLFGGLPQWEMELKPGGQVLVGWSGGDPTKPYALAFDADVVANAVSLLASARVTIGTKVAAQPAILGTTYRGAESAAHTALVAAFTALAGGSTGPLSALQAGFSAAAAALTAFESGAPSYLSTQVRHS